MQFRIRTLLALSFAASLLCGAIFAPPIVATGNQLQDLGIKTASPADTMK
jgi:uncharacterized membrane protein YciS (DUF1049 family)